MPKLEKLNLGDLDLAKVERLVVGKGISLNLAMASEIFGVKPEDVTEEMRRMAKIITFGKAYGMRPEELVKYFGKGGRYYGPLHRRNCKPNCNLDFPHTRKDCGRR